MDSKLSTKAHPDESHEIRRLFMERYRRLNEDYQKEEYKIMTALKSDFVKTFKLDRNTLEMIMETFDGSLLEMYNYCKSFTKNKNAISYE